MATRDNHYADVNLLKFLVSFCLILLFAGGFLYFQQRNSSSIEHVAAEQIKGNFFLAVANIRMLSQQQGRVKQVSYQTRTVSVNQQGKPTVRDNQGSLQCLQVWRQVMGKDIRVAGHDVNATRLKVAENGTKMPQGCRFSAGNVVLFEYFP